jgi:mTERF
LTVKGSKNAQQVIILLSTLGVSRRSLARDKNALPILLSRSPAQLFRLVAFLASDAVRMPLTNIGPLLRRAECAPLLNAIAPIPQLQKQDNMDMDDSAAATILINSAQKTEQNNQREQINDTYRQMSATAWTLRHEIGTEDLGKVIAAYPSVLLLDVETQILPSASYLMNELGIWQDDLPRVLQLYPALLGMDIEEMKRVSSYLISLEVAEKNLGSIFRAFPSLLTLDVEKDMKPVIEFLRKIGISNVGRFVT